MGNSGLLQYPLAQFRICLSFRRAEGCHVSCMRLSECSFAYIQEIEPCDVVLLETDFSQGWKDNGQ